MYSLDFSASVTLCSRGATTVDLRLQESEAVVDADVALYWEVLEVTVER